MNIQLQRRIDRYIGVPLCALFSLLARLRGGRVPTSAPRRILVILLSEMGSLVLAQPMFAQLKRRYPDAEVHAMLFAKNREMLDLLGVVPAERIITLDDRSLSGLVGDSLRAWRRFRRLRFDVVIDCELFARVSAIFSFLTAAAVKVGFHRHTQEGLYRGSFLNRPVLYNPYRHLSQQFLTLVDAIESATAPVAKAVSAPLPGEPPPLAFAAGELAAVHGQLHQDFPTIRDKRLVLVYPGGGILPIRAWPLENYFLLCRDLLSEGCAVAVIGLKEDKAIGRRVVEHCADPGCVDLTGYTKSIRHLLAIFHRAALLVTNDGGPGQFAALTPVPSLIFFGPETPLLYGPLSTRAHCFHVPLSCSPCLTAYNHRNSPCDGDNQCLKRIEPQQVLAKARQLLALGAGRTEA